MFTGTPENIRLRIQNDLANQVFNQFGANVTMIPDDEQHSFLNLDSVIAPGLISWIISFGDRITVIKPESLKQQIVEHCKRRFGWMLELSRNPRRSRNDRSPWAPHNLRCNPDALRSN